MPVTRKFFPNFELNQALFRNPAPLAAMDRSMADGDPMRMFLRKTFVGELALVATYQQIHE